MPQSFWGWVSYVLVEYWPLFLRGTATTLFVAVTGTVIGFLIGLVVAVAKTIPVRRTDGVIKKVSLKLLSILLSVYVEVFRGTPMMVQAMIIFYGALQYLHISMPTLVAAVFVISINTGSYMAEIVRGGIISVDKGQTEGAMSVGMTHWQSMVNVVLPQAVRNIMPSIGNEFVVNIKDSSVLNVISVFELFFAAKSAAGAYLRYFEVFFIAGSIYLFLTFTITRILRWIECKMDGPETYTITGSQSDSRAAIRTKRGA